MNCSDRRRRGPVSNYLPEFSERVLDLAAAGATLTEIARALHVSRRTLERWADQHAAFGDALAVAAEGVGRGRRPRFQSQLASTVLELAGAGMQREGISHALGASATMLQAWAQAHPRFASALRRVDELSSGEDSQ